jgi:hypothetical protein
MVLQSKVFLISMLQKFTPLVSKKKTFIRRIKSSAKAMTSSFHRKRLDDSKTNGTLEEDVELAIWEAPCQPDFQAQFTKTPFPEPRRVIKIRPRVLAFEPETLAI